MRADLAVKGRDELKFHDEGFQMTIESRRKYIFNTS